MTTFCEKQKKSLNTLLKSFNDSFDTFFLSRLLNRDGPREEDI